MGEGCTLTGAVRVAHRAMGCEFGITIPGESDRSARQAADAAFALLDSIEAELSPRIPTSDVSRINALAPGRWTRIGPETTRCLAAARGACRRTGGAFDVTLGRRKHLVLDAARHRARITRAGVAVDPGGIGKGYALDRMAQVLREWGIGSAFLHSGGSTALAIGELPGRWRVALAHPARPAATLGTAVLRAGAFAGSGTAGQGPHIVDPRSGRPARRAAAWAWAPTAALADALSTAFMILPANAIRSVCTKGRAVGIIAAGGSGTVRLTRWGAGPGIAFDRTGRGGRR